MKKHIKITVTFIAISIFMIFPYHVSAQDVTRYAYADYLDSIGLFQGSTGGYELEKTPTRSEAVVMLLRLLGKEKEALSSAGGYPFSDRGWADKYITYAYRQKIVKGVGNNLFGKDQQITENQYCTFLLRALGYSDADNAFDYNNASKFARTILGADTGQSDVFTRGDMCFLSYHALKTKINRKNITLSAKLISENVMSLDDLKKAEKVLTNNTARKKSTTVMIYMIASDLESMQGRGTNDLNEIIDISTNKNFNLYVMAGGTKKWNNSFMQNGITQMYKLNNKSFEPIETLADEKMTQPGTLSGFIKKSATLSPAERYILVMWDHGKGTIGGFGKDELNDNAAMSIADIKSALDTAKVKFDIIGFDACLMGTEETLMAVSGAADFMIASEEMTPACGWYYSTWLDTLSNGKGIDTLTLAKLICDSAVVHASIETHAQSVMSVINTSKANDIYGSLKNILSIGDVKKINKYANTAGQLGAKEGGYDQFDIVDFWKNADVAGKDALLKNVNKSIVYHRASSPNEKLNGLAFYYPHKYFDKYEEVKNMLLSMNYNRWYFDFYNYLEEETK